jgi:ketosteroid isomerase-like protein
MAADDVEVVRRGLEAWAGGDLEAMLAETTEDFEFRPLPQFVDEAEFHGQAEVRAFLERWRGSWGTYETGVDEIADLGDGRVLVLCWQRGMGPDSGIVAHMEWAQIFTLRDGKVARCDNYPDREQALAAEG